MAEIFRENKKIVWKRINEVRKRDNQVVSTRNLIREELTWENIVELDGDNILAGFRMVA